MSSLANVTCPGGEAAATYLRSLKSNTLHSLAKLGTRSANDSESKIVSINHRDGYAAPHPATEAYGVSKPARRGERTREDSNFKPSDP